MAQTSKTSTRKPDSFDVTCVIGTVELSETGTESPIAAAYRIIAEYDIPGTYTFPLPNGNIARITVEYEMPQGAGEGWN